MVTLVVMVRGWTSTGDLLLFGGPGSEIKADFIESIKLNLSEVEIFAPPLDLHMFSMRTPESIAEELFITVDEKICSMANLDRIVLVGYSAGAPIARRIFCMAHGTVENACLGDGPAPWADKIDRMVIVAGITRGWEFSSASPAKVRFFSPALFLIARIIGWLKRLVASFKKQNAHSPSKLPFIWQLRRGAPFIVSTRIYFIEIIERLKHRCQKFPKKDYPLRANGLPSTIVLLGSQDEYLSPSDTTELGPRKEFVFLEVPNSNHVDILRITGDQANDAVRIQHVCESLINSFDDLRSKESAVQADDLDDYLDPMDLTTDNNERYDAKLDVDHVVMIIHGIRDDGFWTKRVAKEVKVIGRNYNLSVRAATPTYGYFSMWDFLRAGGRSHAVFWLLERYADIKSRYPRAKISFVGHSNGTYLAGRALEICREIQFENIVLAGSVIRRSYAWSKFPDQVNRVLNYVGSSDSVVALLPAVFEKLRLRWLDVGGAGAFGFDEANRRSVGASPELYEYRFIEGGHGAAVAEGFWREIARFAILGEVPERHTVLRPTYLRLLFQCAPVITLVGVSLIMIALLSPWCAVALATAVGENAGFFDDAEFRALLALSTGILISWLTVRFIKFW